MTVATPGPRAVRARSRSLVVAAVVLFAWFEPFAVTGAHASASSALELVELGARHERARQDELAVRRYMEALRADPTCEPAYLRLGALRARTGDLREAERVYSVALEHVPSLSEARVARAHVRRELGFREEAVADLLAAEERGRGARSEEPDVATLRVLARWYGEDGQTAAHLAVWRRILASAEHARDAALAREAQRMVRALVWFVGAADPVTAPPAEPDPVRAAIARLAGGRRVTPP